MDKSGSLVFCLVHGADQYPDGRINEETKARCDKAIRLYRKGKVNRLCVTGYSGRNNMSLAEGMTQYLIGQEIPKEHIAIDPRGENTAGEIDIFLSLVGREKRLASVSSWYHLPRIFLIYLLRGKMARLYPSFIDTRFHDIIHEPRAIWKELHLRRKSAAIHSPGSIERRLP